jgi:coenzyme F420-reducing hydrogenase alpha subunit
MNILEKEHPKGALGTVKKHKTTKKQQKLFGIARGMQKGQTSKSYSPAAAKIAKGLSGKEVHKIASKPKGGFRRKSSKSESALMRKAEERVIRLVREEEARLAEQEFSDQLGPGGQPAPPKPRRRSELEKKRGRFTALTPRAASSIQKPFDKMRRRLEKRP